MTGSSSRFEKPLALFVNGKLRIWLRWLAWKAGRPVAALVLLPLAALPWLIDMQDLNPLREPVFDWFQRLHPRELERDKHNVILVRIDERSIAQIGQWPWNRITLANLLQRIEANGAKAIGLDMVLSNLIASHRESTPPHDPNLAPNCAPRSRHCPPTTVFSPRRSAGFPWSVPAPISHPTARISGRDRPTASKPPW